MMDRVSALGLQQDLYNDAVRYLDQAPAFPPEDCAFVDAHRKLSLEDVDTGAIVLAAYLGLGCEADGFAEMNALLRACYLDPAKRAMLVGAVAER
jgi:hypothetical protein